MRFFIFPLAIFLGTIFHSCTVHSGQIVSVDYGVSVPIKDRAIGYVSTVKFLGVGGNRKQQIYAEAKDNLIAYRPLEKEEKYVNMVMDVSARSFLFFRKERYFLTADVVDTTH